MVYTKRIKFFLFFFFQWSALIFAFSSQSSWAQSEGNMVKTSVEFTTPGPAGFTLDEPYTPVVHFNNSTYYLWVDQKFRPWVTQITNGVSTTVPLDTGADYTAQPDGHHRFSLGIDKNGYLHVTGDMHHYITISTGVITPYPARYQKQSILYWKSQKPENVSGGFAFAGGLNAKTIIPGGGWMMGRFFTDNFGELYYSSQVHAYESLNSLGQMAVGLYKYDVTAQTWTSIGGIADHQETYMYNIFPVFFWEDAGLNHWFQNYQAQFKFDSSNRMHFTVTTNTVTTLTGLNRVVYAFSDDAGKTWKKANGAVITGLPLRAIDNLPATADIVADSGTTPAGFGPSVGLAIDKNGKPGISIDNIWHIWDGQNWTTATPQNTSLPPGKYGYRMPNNDMILNASVVGKLLRAPSFDDSAIAMDYPTGISSLDEQTIRTQGIIYGLTDNADKTQSVVRTEVVPASLPDGWISKNITLNAMSYIGESGYSDGTFTVRSYGDQLDGVNDSFTFVYKKVKNDSVISARVDLPETYSSAGVMMRESLASNSKYVALLVNPKPGGKNVSYKVRPATGVQMGGYGTLIPSTPYWVKVVRKGDLFTSYMSPDDINWTRIDSKTVAMNKEIYIGLAVVSNGHLWYSETATFDNVTSSVYLKK